MTWKKHQDFKEQSGFHKEWPLLQFISIFVHKLVGETHWTEKNKCPVLCSSAQSFCGSCRELMSYLSNATKVGVFVACCCLHLISEINESIERQLWAKANRKSRLLTYPICHKLHLKWQICKTLSFPVSVIKTPIPIILYLTLFYFHECILDCLFKIPLKIDAFKCFFKKHTSNVVNIPKSKKSLAPLETTLSQWNRKLY